MKKLIAALALVGASLIVAPAAHASGNCPGSATQVDQGAKYIICKTRGGNLFVWPKP